MADLTDFFEDGSKSEITALSCTCSCTTWCVCTGGNDCGSDGNTSNSSEQNTDDSLGGL